MNSYLQLLRKELLALRWSMGVFVGLTLIWQVFVATRTSWTAPVLLINGLGPLSFLPMWLIWISFQSYSTEWSNDTAYLLLSLPVKGWQVTTTKLFPVMIAFLVALAVTISGFLLLFGRLIPVVIGDTFAPLPAGWYLRNGVNLVVLGLLAVSAMVMLIHFAYITSRLAKRFRGPVLAWILLISFWIISRVGGLIEPILHWVRPLTFDFFNINQGLVDVYQFQLGLSPVLAIWLSIVGLFLLATWLWETQIEIA